MRENMQAGTQVTNDYRKQRLGCAKALFWAWMGAIGVAVVLALTGCSTLDKVLLTRQVVSPAYSTNVVTGYATNLVAVPALTNSLTGEVTPAAVLQVVTPTTTNREVPAVVIYAPSPGVKVAKDLSGSLPAPFNWIASLILGLGTAGYAGYRNKQEGQKVAQILVDNVQTVRNALQSVPGGDKLDAQVIAQIQSAHVHSGVWETIDQMVQKYGN